MAQDLEYLALHLPGYEPFPYLGGVLGLRWAEAAGLRVRSVDFTKNTVAIEQQWTRGAGGVMVSQRPKTRAGRRTLASPDWMMDKLADHVAERGISQDDREAAIFLGSDGQKLDYSNWRSRVWIPAMEAAGLGGLRFHDLRHTAGTAFRRRRGHQDRPGAPRPRQPDDHSACLRAGDAAGRPGRRADRRGGLQARAGPGPRGHRPPGTGCGMDAV